MENAGSWPIREIVKRYAKIVGLLLAVGLVAVQLMPIERTNPLGGGDPKAPRNVQWILRRACYDCHSGDALANLGIHCADLVAGGSRRRSRSGYPEFLELGRV